MGLIQLVYVSRATTGRLSLREVTQLVEHSQIKNQQRGLTGLLLYSTGNFIQLLEGQRSIVQNLYKTIEKDPRHQQVQTLYLGDARQRLFPKWSMGMLNLDGEERLLDRSRLEQVLERTRLLKTIGHRRGCIEVMELLKDFRTQLPGESKAAA